MLDFFHLVIIDGRTIHSAIGLLLSSSALSRHTGIVRFWTDGSVVKNCTIRWAHPRIQPWGKPVPYQCPSCHCIQAWDQKGLGSEMRGDVEMHCRHKGEHGQCARHLVFEKSLPFKVLKGVEGAWVVFGIGKSDSL